MSAVLRRQAIRWQAQEAAGDLPDELYEALADGRASAYEKRVIVNLAKVSRIISDEGVRPYSEFSRDWSYVGSIYGHTDNCELCGAAIKENCRLHNAERDSTILIGNVCVFRYIEIRDESGRVLNDDEKKAFLKGEMDEAKKTFKRQDFAARYPDALMAIKRWSPWLNRYKRTDEGTLCRTVAKRLATHGFLGPKTLKAWDALYRTADAEMKAWEHEREQRFLQRRALAEADAARALAFKQEIARRRNAFSNEAEAWSSLCESISMNSWEDGMAGRVRTKIAGTGVDSLRGGYRRFFDEMHTRANITSGEATMPPRAEALMAKKPTASAWEASFIDSVVSRIVRGHTLTEKQEAVVKKILGA